MATALAGALSCGRCGHRATDDHHHDHHDDHHDDHAAGRGRCPRCDLRWVAAASGSAVGIDAGPFAGVVRAGVVRRYLAHCLDVLPVLVAVAAIAVGTLGGEIASHQVSSGVVAGTVGTLVGYVTGQLALYMRLGRSLGRLALGLRTVDDLTGTPVGAGSWLLPVQPARHRPTVTAALRRGRDPFDVGRGDLPASLAESVASAGADELAGRHRADPIDPPRPSPEPRPSVAIVLGNGERYEIWHALLLGRSPVDRDGGRALLAWPDLSRRLAKTHVLLEWSGLTLWVTDLATAGGTALVSPAGDRTPLVPGVRTAAAVGWTVECGGRSFTVRPGGAVPDDRGGQP